MPPKNLEMELTMPAGSPDLHYDLAQHLRAGNTPHLVIKIGETKEDTPLLGTGDYLPLIKLVLYAPVAISIVRGLFGLLKSFVDLKKERILAGAELEKAAIALKAVQKVEIDLEFPDGRKAHFTFSAFSEEECEQLIKKIRQHLPE